MERNIIPLYRNFTLNEIPVEIGDTVILKNSRIVHQRFVKEEVLQKEVIENKKEPEQIPKEEEKIKYVRPKKSEDCIIS